MALAEQVVELPNAPRDFIRVAREMGIDEGKLIQHVLDDVWQINKDGGYLSDNYRLGVENAALKAKIRKLEHKLHSGRLRARRLHGFLHSAVGVVGSARRVLATTNELTETSPAADLRYAVEEYDRVTRRPESK